LVERTLPYASRNLNYGLFVFQHEVGLLYMIILVVEVTQEVAGGSNRK
jgi:hypothetical protein